MSPIPAVGSCGQTCSNNQARDRCLFVSDPLRISRQAQISKALHISNDIIMP